MSKVETNTIDTVSGSSALQIGDGNTATIGLGKSGDTLTVPSGATLSIAGTINASSGTATGFGETNEPYFLASGTGTQSLTEDVNSTIQYNTLRDSLDSASGYNTSTYTYTVQSGGAGFWYVAAGNYVASISQDKQIDIQIHVNGAEWFVNRYRPGASVNQFLQVHGIQKLNVGNTLLVKIFHNDNSARNASNNANNSFFGGFRIKAF